MAGTVLKYELRASITYKGNIRNAVLFVHILYIEAVDALREAGTETDRPTVREGNGLGTIVEKGR